MNRLRVSPPMQLALIFLLFGTMWILLTDGVSRMIADDNMTFLSKVQTYKGVLFMMISAALIYFVSNKIISKQNELQEELSRQRIAYKNNLALEVFNAQESERKKLGEELHDNINQLLGVVKLYIEHAHMNPAAREEMLVRSSEYLKQVINEIRTLSKALVSPTLSDIGLVESIRDLINPILKVRNIEIVLNTSKFPEEELSATQKLMLYRITQEQLNNILKHSRAEHVLIDLTYERGEVKLVIQDDGIGFNSDEPTSGLGLKNIRHRLELYDGAMNVESTPQQGCRLEAVFRPK